MDSQSDNDEEGDFVVRAKKKIKRKADDSQSDGDDDDFLPSAKKKLKK